MLRRLLVLIALGGVAWYGLKRFGPQTNGAPDATELGNGSQERQAPQAAPAATKPTPPAERTIKGNIHGDEKLYHMPGDQGYDQTIEEQLFATPEEAEAEGFRHARQPGAV